MPHPPSIVAATALSNRLATETITKDLLRNCMTEAHEGADDAAGAWVWREAYDAVEAAVVLFLRRYGKAMRQRAGSDAAMVAMIEKIAARIPSFTRRSTEQVQLQQFSTPPALAFVVAAAARVQPGDVVLEPSAGTGLIAVMAEIAGGRPILNELDEDRGELLQALWPDSPMTRFNAEHIHDRLNDEILPTVVLMNPPFSASPNVRSRRSSVTDRHVSSALARLAPGGRLVTITGANFDPAGPARHTMRLLFSSPIAGHVYRRAGTSFETRLSVYDKTGGSAGIDPIVWDQPAGDIETLLERTEALPERLPSTGHAPYMPPNLSTPPDPTRTQTTTSTLAPRPAVIAAEPLVYDVIADATPSVAGGDRIYEPYRTERLRIPGATEHPTALVQSTAMASVLPPIVNYRPMLPPSLIKRGLLSHAQLETIVYAGAAHAELLPGWYDVDLDTETSTLTADATDGAVRFRRGFSLGDGTGAGKGRQLAGIILDNQASGRQRALYISKSSKLIVDARRDWRDLGGDPDDITELGKIAPSIPIPEGTRIMFLTYKLLASVDNEGRSRLDQITSWLGDKFDGVIVFDEAHAMANAGGGGEGLFGKAAAPSQQGAAGLRLQLALPDARVVYASATSATQVRNLAYAARLGLWGHGTAFVKRNDFVTAMIEGGAAAMEVVARDLKAMGLYLARVLSFEGVEIKALQHRLTPEQRRIYDSYAAIFQVIHQGIQKVLEDTGVITEKGAAKNAHATAVAHSAFESNKQRFFETLITSMICPSLLKAIEQDLARGDAVVIQLVSTHEAALSRRLAEIPADSWDDVMVDCTPRAMIGDYLMTAFPTALQEDYQPDDSEKILSRPIRDAEGNTVPCKAALAERDRLIAMLAGLPPIEAALDQIVNHFGADAVAEITGRSRRLVRKGFRHTVERRSSVASIADGEAFMEDVMRVLVFSDAGGTGRSFHADIACPNQRRRIHYLLQPGWRADNAIQGLGRTHRSNQRIAPMVRTCSTDVRGQKRFTATIARRLAELGALTRGQRQTGGNGIFRPEDNLESDYAKAALRSFLIDLCSGDIKGCSVGQFEKATGLRLFDSEGNRKDDLPPIQRVLNRLLALPIEMQNLLFDQFERRHAERIAAAKAIGAYDLGLETVHADAINLVNRQDIVKHPGGAATELVELRCRHRLHPTTLADAISGTPGRLVMNAQSRHVAVARPGPSFTDSDGVPRERITLIRPRRTEHMAAEAFAASNWRPVDAAKHALVWADEIRRLPSYEERTVFLATGLLLPLWKQLPLSQLQVRRLTTDDGQTFLGLLIDVDGLQGFLDALAQNQSGTSPDPRDVQRAVMECQDSVGLANGWRLRRTRQMGEPRMELVGPIDRDQEELNAIGVFTEIVNFQARYFVPLDDALTALEKLMTAHPAKQSANMIEADD